MKATTVLRTIVLAACVSSVSSTMASAAYYLQDGDIVVVDRRLHGTSFIGGPYELDVISPANGVSLVSFCLERYEYFTYDMPYEVTVDRYAARGGVDKGLLPPSDGEPNNGMDLLSDATGTLYQTYLQGGLLGHVEGWTGADGDLVALQIAFWLMEDESVPANDYTHATPGMSAKLIAWATANARSDHWARVANLWGPDGVAKQSQLTLVPEPASVGVWGCLAAIFGGAFYARRRRLSV